MSSFRVQQIDHVELMVPDRYEAAAWFARIFGCQIMKDFEFWAGEGGPLMISPDGGSTKVALFEGEPTGNSDMIGFVRLAFRVDGAGFLRFLDHIEQEPVYGYEGVRMGRENVVDHDRSWSIYFLDPWNNRFEVTTYDYEHVRQALGK